MKYKLTTDDFIERSSRIHKGKYTYSKSVYQTAHHKITITCPKHGDFKQIAKHHMYGRGCAKCKMKERVAPEFINDYVKISIGDDKYALISELDYNKCSNITWWMDSSGYVNSQKGRMHRFIMQPDSDKEVDHINGDKVDNRRSNLRICSRADNCKNQRVQSVPKLSIYKGVTFSKSAKKWIAQIGFNKKNIYLGCFESERSAAIAYNKKAKELFGEYAHENKIERSDNWARENGYKLNHL